MAEHGTPDQITSQAPFIQALVQKSVTAITNLAGRLSFGMLGESWSNAQGGTAKKMVLRLLSNGLNLSHGLAQIFTDINLTFRLIRDNPWPNFICFVDGWPAERFRSSEGTRPSDHNGPWDERTQMHPRYCAPSSFHQTTLPGPIGFCR